jgi:signal transduction histidine kinase
MKELIINKIKTKSSRDSEIEMYAQFGKISHEFLHDILNPISSILLQLEVLKENYIKEKDIGKDINEINEINSKTIQLIRLFQKNLIEKSEDEIININKEIKEIISLNYYKAKKSKVSITIVEENKITTNISKIKFYQLIINLLSNSIDSFQNVNDGRKRIIQIDIKKCKDTLNIYFSDNGCGMNDKEIVNIFNNKNSKKKSGFGIGMKTTKKILMELNGSIKVKSEIKKGTSFEVKIPIKKPHPKVEL